MTHPALGPPGRPRPYSVSGVFPSLHALAAVLPVLDGVDRLQLIDLPRACKAGGGAPDDESLRALAERIEHGTAGRVAARNVIGYWDVAARYGLLVDEVESGLRLTRRGREAAADPRGRVMGQVAGREGLAHIVQAVSSGHATLASLLPGWRRVLAGNPRFAAAPAAARSLGQRVAALIQDGCLVAHGEHARRLADEAGFRRREPEPAFADLGGGLAPATTRDD